MSAALVSVYLHEPFQRRCELIAAQVALDVIADPAADAASKAMARAVALRQIPREDIAWAIVSAADVAAEAVKDPGNPGASVSDETLAGAFKRNWASFAAVRAG